CSAPWREHAARPRAFPCFEPDSPEHSTFPWVRRHRNEDRMNGIGRRVAIVEGCRTPFARSGTDFKDVSAVELGKIAVRELIARAELDVEQVDHVIYGTVIQSVKEPNIAREVTLGSGLS